MKPILRTLKYLRFFPRQIVGNVCFNTLAIVFNLFSFVLIIPFVELLFGLTVPPAEQPEWAFNRESLTDCMMYGLAQMKGQWGVWKCLLLVVAGYLGNVLLSNLCRYMGLFFLSPIRNGVIQRLRDDLYRRLTELPLSYFSEQRNGDIMSRFSNDLADIEWSVVSTLQSLVKDPINALLFAGVLLFISPKLFLLFLLILPLGAFLIAQIGKHLKKDSQRGQKHLGKLFALLNEDMDGARDIRLFSAQKQRSERFEEMNRHYTRDMIRVARRRELSSPLSEVLGTIGLVAILVIGGTFVFNGTIAASVFIFFVIIFARLIPPIQAIVKAYNSLVKGSASAARIFAVIDAPNPIQEPSQAVIKRGFSQSLELRHISFSYTSDSGSQIAVLHDINLTIPHGSTTAIVGPSGAGKTTLLDLLPRFFDATSGELLIDGTPIQNLSLPAWRKSFGIVSQQCILFDDSILANIALGDPNPDLLRAQKAAHIAHIDNFIETLPDGYNTLLDNQGGLLSGGQRQRLSIARALYGDPDILLLDEATSALDAESERLVQQALESAREGRTTIVVAHRLATVQKADQIVVLSEGKVIEKGSHFSLLSQDGVYKKMVQLQSL